MENSKVLKKTIADLINQGKTKSEIFDELRKAHQRPLDLAKEIRKFPTKENKKKNYFKNILLLILLFIPFTLDIITLSYGGIVWDIALIYIVITFQGVHYQWITFRAIYSLFILFVLFFFSNFDALNFVLSVLILLILVPTFILAIQLEKKLCPHFEENKVRILDENGKYRFILQIVFKD